MTDVSVQSTNYQVENNGLFRMFEQEVQAYHLLLDTLREKQKAIIYGKLEELRDATAVAQSLVRKANTLSKSRLDMIRLMYGKDEGKGFSSAASTGHSYADIMRNASWQNSQNDLMNTLEEIEKINRENQKLLNTSLSLSRELVQFFYPEDNTRSGFYGNDGALKQPGRSKKLVTY